jgi:hypothetical protein
VFLVEVLGNGKRARALIRKGSITYLEHQSALGHMFRLFDETNAPINGSVYINGQIYESDSKTGIILSPYSSVGRSDQSIILSNATGDVVSLSSFNHLKEVYTFQCGLYVDRESLLQKSQSELILRPVLYINGLPVGLETVKKARLKIDTYNDENTPTSQAIDDLKFATDNKETVHVFTVPDNLRNITFTVTVDIRPRSNPVDTTTLTATQSFAVNSLDGTPILPPAVYRTAPRHIYFCNKMIDSGLIEDLHLRYDNTGYQVYLLGKAGEARRNRRLTLALATRHVQTPVRIDVQTDENGAVALGALNGVTSVTATIPLREYVCVS